MSADTVDLKTFAKMMGRGRWQVRRWVRDGTIVSQGIDECGEPEFSLEYATRVVSRVKEAKERGHRWRYMRFANGDGPIPIGPGTTPERMSPQAFARLTAWKRRNVMKGSSPPPNPQWDPDIAAANLRAHIAREVEAAKAKAPKGPDWSEVAKATRARLKKMPRIGATKGKAPAKPRLPRDDAAV
jgi:hypothetical protein